MSATQNQTQSSFTQPGKKKKSRKMLWIGLALLGLIVLILAARGRAGPVLTQVTVEKAVKKTITQVVSATGKIQPEVEVKIFSEVAGEVIELPLREGAPVKKGDLLVAVRPDFYRFQVEQSLADLAATKAAAAQSKVLLLKSEEDLKRSETLYAKKLISESDIVAARATYDQNKASFDSAEANINRVSGLVSQAKDNLAKTRIFAPIDGTISLRSTELGERVVATGQFTGTEIMRVADLGNMEVRVNINENDIVNVKVGDRARIQIDAFPGGSYEGTVKEIGSAAKTTGANTQEEVTNFQVKIRVLDKTIPLRPGMSATADVETQTVKDVVAVPIQAVTVRAKESNKTVDQLKSDRDAKAAATKGTSEAAVENDKQKQQRERADRESLQRVVFVHSAGSVKLVNVETGIADLTHMEIKQGLNEGDEVVTGSYAVVTRTLTDGMKVKIEQVPVKDKKP